jgi:prolyl oligopeptidase
MNPRTLLPIVRPAALLFPLFAASAFAATLPYPGTAKQVVRDTLHGVVVEDPYRWLEEQKAPATREWLDRQIAFTDSVLATVPGRASIEKRLSEMLKVETRIVPAEFGGRLFYTKRGADQDLSVLCMRDGPDGKEEILVDPNGMSPDRSISVLYYGYSPDGSLVGIATRHGGEDEIEIKLMDTKTKKDLADRLPKARYFGMAIRPDRKGIYYSRMGANGPRIHYHAMGADTSTDKVIFGDGYDAGKILPVQISENGRWLLITVLHGSAARKVELYIKDVLADGPVTPLVNDVDAWFTAVFADNHIYLRTNWQAPNQRVLRADLTKPARDQWQEVIPESKFAMDDLEVAGGKLVVRYLENVVTKLRIFDANGRAEGAVEFETLGTVDNLKSGWTSSNLYFDFESFAVPGTIFRYDVAKGTRTEWFRERVPVRSQDFEVNQVWYTSKDGTDVPMFVAHKKGIKLDGTNPTLLWGYGGFTVNELPAFSHNATLWMERGGVYVLANLRGGSEFGEQWHRNGMLENKQNTFDDFIAAAQHLVAAKYTSPSRLAIGGGSNGGLLVGAFMTQRPDLCRAVYCGVPLIDMLRYHKFLVARFWVPEYGSADDPAQFEYIHAYSPYQHVKPGTEYPAVMFMTGDADTRVDPLHARKMTALMQGATGSDRPVLLHYDLKQGHSGGGKATSLKIQDDTDRNLFLMWQLGMLGAEASAQAKAPK